MARANRLVTPADFRTTLRRGRRDSRETMVVSVAPSSPGDPARFGFVVTKKVGNAVIRNLVRRRLKAVARELVDGGVRGIDVVVRPLPASVDAGWAALRDELRSVVEGSDGR
nr:ribonuclease P protein component [Terrimesophilobacter mesophilus]